MLRLKEVSFVNDTMSSHVDLKRRDDESGREALSRFSGYLERLQTAAKDGLRHVSQHAENLAQFYDALVELRTILQSAREVVRDIERELQSLHFSRRVSYHAVDDELKPFRKFADELDELLWSLPRTSRTRDAVHGSLTPE